MIARTKQLTKGLASVRVTIAALVGAAAVTLAGQDGRLAIGTYVAIPFGVLFLNLIAALATNGTLRAQRWLSGFHLALAALALLVTVDRLTAFYGHVEVTEGTAFDSSLVTANVGPLHRWALDEVRFVQAGFAISYAPGMKRRDTVNTVLVPQNGNAWRQVTVGDDVPLVAGGYRFYTSFNKGFAPVFTFTDRRGTAHGGAVHLPSYPLNYFRQGNEWRIPGSAITAKLWLHLDRPVYSEDAPWRFRTPDAATLVLMLGQERHELAPGDTLPIDGGVLRYEGLRTWMGYTISRNSLVPWMLATAIIAVLCLGAHAGMKMWRTPWQRDPDAMEAADA